MGESFSGKWGANMGLRSLPLGLTTFQTRDLGLRLPAVAG
jgi:hypothetical protein